MSFNKYCDICDTLVSCLFSPNYCPWCGKDLRAIPLVEFSGIEGRLSKLNEIRGFPDPPDKIPWDRYYAHKTGRHLLLNKVDKHYAPQVEIKQISLF